MSMMGNVLTASQEAPKISTAILVFMVSQAAGRVIVTAVNFSPIDLNVPMLFAANAIDLIAFILLTVLKSTYYVVICGAVLCGLAFGIAWCTFPTIASLQLPGGQSRMQINLGITVSTSLHACARACVRALSLIRSHADC